MTYYGTSAQEVYYKYSVLLQCKWSPKVIWIQFGWI